MTTKRILITGATGETGGYALRTLLAQNIPVRALVHSHDARSEKLRAQGVEITQGDLLDFDAVRAALEGVSTAYFVFPIQIPGILEATAYFAQAASEAGLNAIVNMSQITARREAKSHAARNHWIAERLLDRSRIPTTHLRPTLFAEWLTYFAQIIREKSILPLPFGEARYAPIAAEDQGRAIAAILQDPSPHAGKIYPLFGLTELSQHQIAELLTRTLGRTITYIPMDVPPFLELLGLLGFNAHFQQHIGAVAQDCREGICSGTNNLIHQLTGHEPLGMAEYVTMHKKLFT